MNNTLIRVGILVADKIRFQLDNSIEQEVYVENSVLCFDGKYYDELLFDKQKTFTLYDVKIGIDFHWQQKNNQTFFGVLRFVVENNKVRAINVLPIEEYLVSVISSEMNENASLEFLKAHAVISRSWVMSKLLSNPKKSENCFEMRSENNYKVIKWYNNENHTLFDVCADDHCQRYQGIICQSTSNARDAVESTRGKVLMYMNEICDARFSKCCGGVLEQFEYCWEDESKPYLCAKRDENIKLNMDLTNEEEAKQWIMSVPKSFCNTTDEQILSQVLKQYDQTTNFYRWIVKYSTSEISDIVRQKTQLNIGEITDIIPLARGKSGRIWRLQITGTEGTLVIGKELEIRRVLSKTHLYSSAFVVEKQTEGFILHGAGWGHGVGLCQIGAAMMGEQGYHYDEILQHYYPHAEIKTID